jgi:hypothetical protein
MDHTMDGRRALRIQTRFEALYSAGREEGSGTMVNVSYSGALIEDVSLSPKLHGAVRLHVFLDPAPPEEILAEVVRVTAGGFAVIFKNTDARFRSLVNDAAALVGSRS